MVFKEDNQEIRNKDNSFSDDVDLSILDDVDLISLKNEMDTIKKAIGDDSLDLNDEEKIKLENDLKLISKIYDEKLKFDSKNNSRVESNKNISKNSNEVIFKENVQNNISFDKKIIIDENESISNISENSDLDNNGFEENVSSDETVNADFSVDELLLNSNENSNLNSDNVLVFEEDISDSGDLILDNDVSDEDINYIEDIDQDISVDDALGDLITDYSDDVAIKVENLSMDFKVSKDKIDTLKEFVIRTIKRNKSSTKTVHALKNISFEITKGDRVGIIGFNGAGKSTLLKLLSCVYYPTEGSIITKGKIAPLLELGAGFDPNYTGKDNIFLNGAFLGFPEEFLKEKYDEIVEFSELGDAINYHVKTYSSGMRAKLGFSIATIVEPDILILDEILSVGDIKFRRKSADKLKSLINSGITVLIVSHSVGQIRDLCNKAIWLDNGELKMMGNVNEVCDEYVKASTKATSEQLENLDLN